MGSLYNSSNESHFYKIVNISFNNRRIASEFERKLYNTKLFTKISSKSTTIYENDKPKKLYHVEAWISFTEYNKLSTEERTIVNSFKN